MKAFLIHSSIVHGSAQHAGLVFADDEDNAFQLFARAMGGAGRIFETDGRTIRSAVHSDFIYEETFVCKEVDLVAGDVVLSEDYYGPSLSVVKGLQ
jgi:hypothetical protein